MKSSHSLILVYIFSFFCFLMIFILDYPVDHHAYIRIIEQNIAACNNWSCFKVSSFDHNMRGILFIHFLIRKFYMLFGINNALITNLVGAALFNSLFICSLFYIIKKKIEGYGKVFLWLTAFLISSPLILKQIFTTEDNLYYYGPYLFFLYFLFNKKLTPMKDGLIAGCMLGLAISLHVSPMVFIFIFALLPFNVDRIKIAVCSVTSVFAYFIFHVFTHFSDFWYGSIVLAFKQWPLIVYLGKAFSLERGATLEGHGVLEQIQIGFENMNGYFHFVGYLSWICLIIFFVLNSKNIRIDLKGWFLLFLSLCPVFLWEAHSGERWDFFLLTLLFLFVQIGSQAEWEKSQLLIGFIILMAINTGAILFTNTPYQEQKSQMVKELKEELTNIKKYEIFVFDLRFLKIDPFVISHLSGKEKDIYFSDGERFYQTYFSLIAKGVIDKARLWDFRHFEAWNVIDAPSEPLGVRQVSDGCQVTRRENVYISKSLIESIKKNCHE